MSSDKRTVTTDALETLGFIITPNEKRDAIHLAVENVVAAHDLRPGMDVGFSGFLNGEVGVCDGPVGIVDPFLRQTVRQGERFWLVVYPRQITSLRHVWTHPAFPESEVASASVTSSREASEQWLRDFIGGADCPAYETVIAKAIDNRDAWDSSYLHFNDSDAHGDIPPEFWTHVEVVTGRTIPQEDRAEHFSCSC